MEIDGEYQGESQARTGAGQPRTSLRRDHLRQDQSDVRGESLDSHREFSQRDCSRGERVHRGLSCGERVRQPLIRADGLEYGSERLAAMAWSYVAQGANPRVYQVVNRWGYSQALERLHGKDAELLSMAGKQGDTWIDRAGQYESERVDRYMHTLDRLGVSVITPGDALWPRGMYALGERAPLALWVRGRADVLKRILGKPLPSISIVGSRTASTRGIRTALDFAYELASEYVVTSGGAFGIDVAAHKGALAAQGATVIFSAAGVDRVYPLSHAALFEQVWAGGGLVISEFALGTAPHAHRFLLRNRLIAAFSRATVVVEAPVRSGALSTARAALEMGRPVGAVPGAITAPTSAGCHELIRNGGTLVARTSHIRELAAPIGRQLELWEWRETLRGQDSPEELRDQESQEDSENLKECEDREKHRERRAHDERTVRGEWHGCAEQEENEKCKESEKCGECEEQEACRAEGDHSAGADFFSPAPSRLGALGTKVFDAVPKSRPASLESIARVAGVNADTVRAEIGKLALMGMVVRRNGLWVKQIPAPTHSRSQNI